MDAVLPYALLGTALLVFGWVMFRLMVRNRLKRGKQRSPERQVADFQKEMRQLSPRGERALRDAPSDILRWQVEMTETARDLKGELDSKIAIVNAAVRLADQRIAELKHLLEQVELRDSSDKN